MKELSIGLLLSTVFIIVSYFVIGFIHSFAVLLSVSIGFLLAEQYVPIPPSTSNLKKEEKS